MWVPSSGVGIFHVASKQQRFFQGRLLTLTQLKALADNKFTVAKIMILVFDRIENIVGKGENASYQHFLLFLQCFQKLCIRHFTTQSRLLMT